MTKPPLSSARRRVFIIALGLFGVLLAAAVAVVLKLTGAVTPVSPEELQAQQVKRAADNPDRPSVLIVGDSFLETHWPFKRVLGKDLPLYLERRGVNAVLTAMAGTGPQGYFDRTLKLLPRVKPKLVIVFYFAGNDVTDTMREHKLRPQRSGPCRCDKVKIRTNDFDWEMMKRCGVQASVVEAAERRVREPHDPGGQRVNPHLICAALEYPPLYRANLAVQSPEARAAWRKIEVLLRQIRDEARVYGAELHLVAIPAALQVDPGYGSFLRQMNFEIDEGLTRARGPQRRLQAFCEREQIGFLDLLPACLASPQRKQLYFQYDDHFRGEGHELAYGLVLKQVIDPWLAARSK